MNEAGKVLTTEEFEKLKKEDPKAAARFQRNDNLTPSQVKNRKVGRNDPCPCGSGKKFKNCCSYQQKDEDQMNPTLDAPRQRIRSFFGISSFENPGKKLYCRKTTTYAGSEIYVTQYRNMFQYVFAKNDKIYQDHFFLRPPFLRKLLSFVGLHLYNKKELSYGIEVALNGAIRSIDQLNQIKPTKAEPIPLEKK